MIDIPIHHYTQHSNKTLNWVGTDQSNIIDKILSDPDKFKTWSESGWTTETIIEYQFNENGFRTDTFDSSRRIAVFGSSQTVGVGLHQWQTWPYLLGKAVGIPVWNLATGTGTFDTQYRMIKYFANTLNIEYVVLMTSNDNRWEFWDKNGTPMLISGTDNPIPNLSAISIAWGQHINNKKINQEKNLEAIKYICYAHRLPLVVFDIGDANKYKPVDPVDWSRCLSHVGPRYHQRVQEYIVDCLLTDIKIP